MHRKIEEIIQPRSSIFFVMLALFSLASIRFSIPLAIGEGVIVLLLLLFYQRSKKKREREVLAYIENVTGNMDSATKGSMLNAPLPMLIFRPENGDIIWTNDQFLQLSDQREHLFDAKLSAVVPEFDTRWLMEGKNHAPSAVTLGTRRFWVYGNLVRTGDKAKGFLATTYWVDMTNLLDTKDQFEKTRPVIAIILVDNHEDLLKNLPENTRSALLADVDERLSRWADGAQGILRKYERGRYLFVFEQQYLPAYLEAKFDILDSIHEVTNPDGIHASVSIGIGQDGETFEELLQFANLSVDMALSRGGDQAVIRNRFTFEFYGGRSTELHQRTKVKSRVMANVLSALFADSSHVYVMGHKAPDMDAMGAAAGVLALARKKGVPAHIILDTGVNPAKPLVDKLQSLPEYQGAFITGQDAMLAADARSLVVVVDTNRPEQVQSPELLQSCNRVAVIDHHRRAATYIEGAALNFHEPYASSACELVCELLQYVVEPTDLLRTEAEALLSGIVLDTKNFTVRTGGRTFEAAAYLRRCGADTGDVKRMFQSDLSETFEKYSMIQSAKIYRDGIAIASLEKDIGRIVAAQAADELLNIVGIHTSFVLYSAQQQVIISARSLGETNVQIVLEQLGGGGNSVTAGAQVQEKTLEETVAALTQAIDQYLNE